MKTQVFVLIPYDVPPETIGDYEQMVLEPHRMDPDHPKSVGRYDYLVGTSKKTLHDPVAVGRLPSKVARTYAGKICERANLPEDLLPGAVVTHDGQWHDLGDFGWRLIPKSDAENQAAIKQWRKRYTELLAYENCWVLEVWAHS